MSFIDKLIKDNKEAIEDYIFDDKLQKKIITKLNENIDIPFISEKTEAKYLNAIYDSVEKVIKAQIIKKL